ncbi:MAG: redoxin domain-containing protein [Nitrosopumilaceae archaeon]|nr:redoxin domain-containing protein [Nitrosopumilaceae archaeon]
MFAQIGKKAPNFKVSSWVQGIPTNIDIEKDKIIIIEVFQVNCPGCFIYGIPSVIDVYNKYKLDGVTVLGIATAFEDYDKNTLENLKLLLKSNVVIGETRKILGQYNYLDDNKKLKYKIPFPVAMDSLIKHETNNIDNQRIMNFIYNQIPDFDSRNNDYQNKIKSNVITYLKSKEYITETFELFSLQGTPSTIIIDRKGILRDVIFGQGYNLEMRVKDLINE